MTEDQIKHMVNRFLGWRLPENFSPDCGISFKKTFNDHLPQPSKYEPSGTCLFDATQATAMVRYMVEGVDQADGTDRRIKAAYDAFRDGCTTTDLPRWENASPWIRDLMKVAYLQGTLDR